MAMQWAWDRGGLLYGQPAGEHQTERVGAAEPFRQDRAPAGQARRQTAGGMTCRG